MKYIILFTDHKLYKLEILFRLKSRHFKSKLFFLKKNKYEHVLFILICLL